MIISGHDNDTNKKRKPAHPPDTNLLIAASHAGHNFGD